MEQRQFKGFQDIVIRDGLWSFKGETVWSGDITELWKYVRISIKKDEHKHQVSMQCAIEGTKETCIEIIEKRIKWQKDLIEQAEGKENIINTCECIIHQLETIIKLIKEKEE